MPRITIEELPILQELATAELKGIFGGNQRAPSRLNLLSDMSEMTSLRLQMSMDRRSKFLSTLSNVMAKISTTQSGITQNIK